MSWSTSLLDLLYPKKCVGCGKPGGYVCERCEVGLWEGEQICPACRRPSRYGTRHEYCKQPDGLDGLTCLWAYEGIARVLIKKAKYKFYYDLLGELLVRGSPLVDQPEFFGLREFLAHKPVLLPVPLYSQRERERGFNQSKIVCLSLSGGWGLETENWLIRTRDTGHQTLRTRQERLEAVREAFSLVPRLSTLSPHALLVDDVWTTGATMAECCRVLKRAGVRKVWGLVLAK